MFFVVLSILSESLAWGFINSINPVVTQLKYHTVQPWQLLANLLERAQKDKPGVKAISYPFNLKYYSFHDGLFTCVIKLRSTETPFFCPALYIKKALRQLNKIVSGELKYSTCIDQCSSFSVSVFCSHLGYILGFIKPDNQFSSEWVIKILLLISPKLYFHKYAACTESA